MKVRYASYLSPEWGTWAQYCRGNAGYYPQFPRALRRKLEILAHKEGIQQIPKMWAKRPFNEIKELLEEAAK